MPVQRPLTPRQQVILRAVARGRTNKEIAAELGISEQGVKVHVSRLLERYGAENRVQLVGLTRTWPDAQDGGYAVAAAEIAGIRAGLAKTYDDATAFGKTHGANGHQAGAPPLGDWSAGAPSNGTDLVSAVRSLREVLAEINVALKLARELPSDVNVVPIVDAIRARVSVALDETERLDLAVDRQRAIDQQPQRSAI